MSKASASGGIRALSLRVLLGNDPRLPPGNFRYSSDIQSFELGHFDSSSIDKSTDIFAVSAAK
jgi:hypothetical protein